jgi:ABC-type glycerol-3-phosphate transport system permease component
MADTLPAVTAVHTTPAVAAGADRRPPTRSRWRMVALAIGAFVFLFPFYYMLVGSLQRKTDTSPKGALPLPGNLSLHNYGQINAALNLAQTLLNSVIFTAGVILGTCCTTGAAARCSRPCCCSR